MSTLARGLPLLLLFHSAPALAEVADKVPSLTWLWGVALAGTAFAFLLGRIQLWLGLIPGALSSFYSWAIWAELASFDVGPSIRSELGQSYVDQANLAATLGLVGPLVALALALILRLRTKSSTSR